MKLTVTNTANSFYHGGKSCHCISHYENLPKGWVLARFMDVCEIYTGNSINEAEKKKKYHNQTGGLPYITTKDVDMSGTINYENGIKIPNINGFKTAPSHSVFLCIEGGNAGKKIALTKYKVCFGNKLCCFSPYLINSEYLYYYINSDVFSADFRNQINGIIGGVSVNKIKLLTFPIPPLAEQERIINNIKGLFQQLEMISSRIKN